LDAARASPAQIAGLVGAVFQDPASQLVMERAGDDVAFGLENRAWPLEAMRSRVPEALAAVGLAGFAGRVSARLSGGEQQRLAIAGALAPRPRLLVFDEPTANLDPEGTAAVFAQLAALRAQGVTIVLVEHRVEHAWPLADLVLALDAEGAPLELGTPDEVLARSSERLAGAGIWLPGDDDAPPSRPPQAPDPAAEVTVLTLQDVGFAFGRGADVLEAVDLRVAPGERVALVGPNGSGKTTLLRVALGLLRPGTGTVRLMGRDPARLPAAELARSAGYVVQDPELGFVADTVAEEVTIGLAAPDRHRALDLAQRLDLPIETFGGRSPYRLSGGEQRRLSLVTALARRPRLLALDEPTFGQDRHGAEALVAALDELVEDGSALVAATHDERFVRRAAGRRVEMAAGRIVADLPIGLPAAGAPR
jgi:energy-coupling factor transport system ATP-binding protein